MLLRYFFGEDVFISYTRADAITYAAGLAGELTRRDFSCFLDQWGTPPGRELPKPLRRALARSMTLVVIGSEGVIRSAAVEHEIRTFRKTGRTIIPIDFEGALPRAAWFELIAGLALTKDSPEALASGTPSAAVLNRIEKSFQYTRRNQRARRMFTAGTVLLSMLVIVSIYYSRAATTSAQNAREQERIARDQEGIAHRNAAAASAKAEEARQQAELARAEAARAEEQQRLAEERQKLALSRELASSAISELAVDPDLSLLLSTEAVRLSSNSQTESSLKRSLSESRVRLVLNAQNGAMSPDGRFVATPGHCSSDASRYCLRITEITSGNAREIGAGERFYDSPEYSPDGRLVIVLCGHTESCLFDVSSGRLTAELRGHNRAVNSVRFSHDGKLIVSASEDHTARVWEAATGRSLTELRFPKPAFDSRFSPDDEHIVTSTGWHAATVWETGTGQLVRTFPEGPGAWRTPAIWSPDGKLLLTFQNGSPARLWNTAKWELARELDREDAVQWAEFSASGESLLTVSNGNVQVWQTNTGRRIGGRFGNSVERASFHPSGEFVVTGGDSNSGEISADTVRLWDRHGRLLAILPGHRVGAGRRGEFLTPRVRIVSFSNSGHWALTAAEDETTRVWDSGIRPPVTTFRAPDGERITAAVFSPDGRVVASPGGARTYLWDPVTARPLHVLDTECATHPGPVFSRDSRLVATVDRKDAIHVWQVDSGRKLTTFAGHPAGVREIVFSPDSELVASTGVGVGKVWTSRTGRELFTPSRPVDNHSGPQDTSLSAAAFSPDGRLLVTVHDDWAKTVRVWEVRTGRNLFVLKEGNSYPGKISFSADGQYVVTAGRDKSAIVWSLRSGRRMSVLRAPAGNIENALFVSDGSVTTRGYDDQTNRTEIRRWDLVTQSSVVAGAFHWAGSHYSHDGRCALLTRGNGDIEILEVSSGLVMTVLRGFGQKLESGGFSPSGDLVAVVGGDGTARIYACELCGSSDSLLKLASERVRMNGRKFTEDERRKFLRGLLAAK